MSINRRLAAQLQQIAQLLEVLGADRFRIAAHTRAARIIKELPGDVAALADDRSALLTIKGIGPKVADKVQEYARIGRIAELDELLKQTPQGLLDVLEIPGLGPKTVGALWRQADVTSLDDLNRIIDDGSILKLPRMGVKTVEKLRHAISFAMTHQGRTPLGIATMAAEELIRHLQEVSALADITVAGSLQRGKETVGAINILAACDDAPAIIEALRAAPGVIETLTTDVNSASVHLAISDGSMRPRQLQVDLRISPHDSFGAAFLHWTGSRRHIARLNQRALSMGFILNEYGLFQHDGDPVPPQRRGVAPIASATELDVYSALDLPLIPPELREDQGEFDLPARKAPDLIRIEDIVAELHAHTTASDGVMSIAELAHEAQSRGMHTIAVTDHSVSQTIAGGLSPQRLVEHIEAVREVDKNTPGVRILAGAEVDILPDGSLDYDDELLRLLDIVVASPHAALTQNAADATRRLIKAVSHPLVRILGHPTGRLLCRREGLSPDMQEVIAAAAQHNTAMEINSHPKRLDLRDNHVRAATEAGALIAINCDVHTPADFEHLRFGVTTARRGWLATGRCVNTWPASKLFAWLGC